MRDLDISSLHRLYDSIPICPRCYAIWDLGDDLGYILLRDDGTFECKICGVRFKRVEGGYDLWQFLKEFGYMRQREIEKNPRHAMELSRILEHHRLEKLSTSSPTNPDVSLLLQLLNEAEDFVHFSTFGISSQFIGALKIIGQRGVSIRGIVSNANSLTKEDLVDFRYEGQTEYPCNQFHIQVFKLGATKNIPHQKFIIIDGLVALKGSANLTLSGWRKSARSFEIIEVVTRLDDVISLNNKFFSPLWVAVNDIDEIVLNTNGIRDFWEKIRIKEGK